MKDMRLEFFTKDESFPFFIQYGGHEDTMFMHLHEDFSELVVVLDGTAEHVVGDEHFPVSKGDVFVMGSTVRHGYINAKGLRICNVMFRPEALISSDDDVKQLAGFHALFLLEAQQNTPQNFRSRLKLSSRVFPEICHLLDTAVSEYSSELPAKKTMLKALFMQITVTLSRLYDTPDEPHDIGGMAEAAAFMETHYMEDIPLSRLLEISHYSQRHFIRLFSAAYNTTPQKYLTGIRLRRAVSLLRDSSMSVTEVALGCGFADPNYFSRAFRRMSGMTPSQYRNAACRGLI